MTFIVLFDARILASSLADENKNRNHACQRKAYGYGIVGETFSGAPDEKVALSQLRRWLSLVLHASLSSAMCC